MQKKYEDRILFLKQFAKELIIQSKPSGYEETAIEKIGEGEFIPLVPITETTKPEFLKLQDQEIPHKFGISGPENLRIFLESKRIPIKIPAKKSRYRIRITEPIKPRRMLETIQPRTLITRTTQQLPESKIIPQPEPTGEIINLGKLNYLVQDPRVTVIECSGPGKFILAKTTGQPTVTKTSLNKQEIQEIMESFSQKARIPIISGLFKAAVGNLIITAVISELVGSRFIITKMTPQFMLETRAY